MSKWFLYNIFICLILFIVSCFGYGLGRTLVERFGFSIQGFMAGIVSSVIVVCFVLGCVVLANLWLKKEFGRPYRWIAIVFVVGVLSSECMILSDEVDFAREVLGVHKNEACVRNRLFPYAASNLVYTPEGGIWVTE